MPPKVTLYKQPVAQKQIESAPTNATTSTQNIFSTSNSNNLLDTIGNEGYIFFDAYPLILSSKLVLSSDHRYTL